jgi:manganese efflux pump family protein
MSLLYVLGIALALSMDAFAVSVGFSLGRLGLTRTQAVRMAAHFGLFQLGMPILGWLAGKTISGLIQSFDHWVAAGLLVFVGGKMIIEAVRDEEEKLIREIRDRTKGWPLIVLSLATSLDALAVGLSFAALGAPVLFPAGVIGAVCFSMTLAGAKIGPILGKLVGEWAEAAGGVVLILIAIKILIEHLS